MITSRTGIVTAYVCALLVALMGGCQKADAPKAAATGLPHAAADEVKQDTPKADATGTQPAAAEGAKHDAPKGGAVEPPQAPKVKITARAIEQAAAHNKQGLGHAAQKNYRKAIVEFRKAVELDSRNPEYLYHLGLSLSYQEETMDEAVAIHLKAIAMKPADMKFLVLNHYNLACTYALQGKKDKAFEHLEKLASLDSRSQFHLVQSDKDFDSIRDTPRFRYILEKIAKARRYDDPAKPEEPRK